MDPLAAPPPAGEAAGGSADLFDMWTRPQSPALHQPALHQTRMASPPPPPMASPVPSRSPAPVGGPPLPPRASPPPRQLPPVAPQPLPDFLQQPQPSAVPAAPRTRAHTTDSLPPNFDAYPGLYQDRQEGLNTSGRVRLDTADALLSFGATQLHPQRARLGTADAAVTMASYNLSPGQTQPQQGGMGLMESERTRRLQNGANGHQRANTVDVGGYDPSPTPRMANKAPAIAEGERKQLISMAPPLPLGGAVQKEARHVGFPDVGFGEGLTTNDGNKESRAGQQLGNTTELFRQDKVNSPTLTRKKGFELTASNEVFERIIASTADRDADDASDVSSLSDTVWSRKQQQQAGARGNLAPTSGVTSAVAALWKKRSVRLKSRYAHQYDGPDHQDTATTAATSIGHSAGRSVDQNSQALETIDSSLEHRLFEHGAYGRRRVSHPSMGRGSSEGSYPPASGGFVPSPLCAAADHERSQARLGGMGHRRRWTAMDQGSINGNEFDSGSSIQGSWLVPSAMPPRTPPRHRMPSPKEDLIDITEDEPVDPFSGLIGMPASIGCESSVVSGSDGGSFSGMNVFGMAQPAFSFVETPTASPGDTSVPLGEETSASTSKLTPGRRPSHRSRSSTFDEFDPLLEEEILQSQPVAGSVCSPLRPSAMPPRHHKDDPLLSRSKYRGPVQPSKKNIRHQRSSSLGGAGIGGTACMFGSIALSETIQSGGVASDANLEWDGIAASTSVDALQTPGSVIEEDANAKPSPSSCGDLTALEKGAERDGDSSSCGSFEEEFNRVEGKRKVLKNEMKHVFGKVLPGKAGRRLLGKDAEMKRAGGMLT